VSDVVAILLVLYACAVLVKQASRRQGEIAQVCLLVGLGLLPLLLVGWFTYHGRPLDMLAPSEPNRDAARWWVIHVPREGSDAIPINLLAALFWLVLLTIAATLATWGAAALTRRQRQVRWLSIHKALLKWPIVIVGALVLLRIDVGTIVLGTSVLVLGIGFVLRDTLENLLTGLTLELEGTVRQGDWIQVGDATPIGRVYEKTWRAAKILTANDESITIPNRMLGGERIKNVERPQREHARVLRVSASYDDPPLRVKDILRDILRGTAGVEPAPEPLVRMVAFEDSSIAYELKFWISDYRQRLEIEDRILTAVWYAFREAGVRIPFPLRTVELQDQSERQTAQEARAQAHQERADFLARLPVFALLGPAEHAFVACNAVARDVAAGEILLRRGERGDALYFVMRGRCLAVLPDGRRVELPAGKYFGEMGLLSSRPRTADVLAADEGARVLRIDRRTMLALFDKHPEMKVAFQLTDEERRRELHESPAAVPAARPPWTQRLKRGAADILRPW